MKNTWRLIMVSVFTDLIIFKVKTFEQVPDSIKDKVEAELKRLGYDTDGILILVNHTTE